jgi:hypothetical protein
VTSASALGAAASGAFAAFAPASAACSASVMRRIRKVLLGLRVVSSVTSANFACRSFSFILFRFAISFFIVLLMVLSFRVGPARTIRSGGFP